MHRYWKVARWRAWCRFGDGHDCPEYQEEGAGTAAATVERFYHGCAHSVSLRAQVGCAAPAGFSKIEARPDRHHLDRPRLVPHPDAEAQHPDRSQLREL